MNHCITGNNKMNLPAQSFAILCLVSWPEITLRTTATMLITIVGNINNIKTRTVVYKSYEKY